MWWLQEKPRTSQSQVTWILLEIVAAASCNHAWNRKPWPSRKLNQPCLPTLKRLVGEALLDVDVPRFCHTWYHNLESINFDRVISGSAGAAPLHKKSNPFVVSAVPSLFRTVPLEYCPKLTAKYWYVFIMIVPGLAAVCRPFKAYCAHSKSGSARDTVSEIW